MTRYKDKIDVSKSKIEPAHTKQEEISYSFRKLPSEEEQSEYLHIVKMHIENQGLKIGDDWCFNDEFGISFSEEYEKISSNITDMNHVRDEANKSLIEFSNDWYRYQMNEYIKHNY